MIIRLSIYVSTLISVLLYAVPSFSLELLSDKELSTTIAQSGKGVDEEHLDRLMREGHLISTLGIIRRALPLDAEIEVEGFSIESDEENELEQRAFTLDALTHASRISIDRIEFNDIRVVDSPFTFGSTAIEGLQVDQNMQVHHR